MLSLSRLILLAALAGHTTLCMAGASYAKAKLILDGHEDTWARFATSGGQRWLIPNREVPPNYVKCADLQGIFHKGVPDSKTHCRLGVGCLDLAGKEVHKVCTVTLLSGKKNLRYCGQYSELQLNDWDIPSCDGNLKLSPPEEVAIVIRNTQDHQAGTKEIMLPLPRAQYSKPRAWQISKTMDGDPRMWIPDWNTLPTTPPGSSGILCSLEVLAVQPETEYYDWALCLALLAPETGVLGHCTKPIPAEIKPCELDDGSFKAAEWMRPRPVDCDQGVGDGSFNGAGDWGIPEGDPHWDQV